MPRAGSGGGRTSSPRRSSGGHSSSRSSGGHRISSRSSGSSRAGSARSTVFRSSSSSSYRRSAPPPPSFGGTRTPPPPPFRGPGMPLPRRYSGRTYRGNYYGGSPSSPAVSVIASVIVLVVILFFVSVFFSAISSAGRSDGSALPASTRNREKLNAGLSFDSGCIVDEIGWFDSVSAAGRQLRTFYDKTGVQPYIVLLQYHPELATDSQKESYAQDYYEENIDNEATFLYMYFAEEDVDNEVGYMCYVNGKQVDSVMDAEAVDIFWGYLDRNWYSGMSTDDLFVNAFTSTAETIMAKTRTKTEIIFILVAGVVIIGIIAAVITAMKTKRRHERERAEETQRILNTPLPDDPLTFTGENADKQQYPTVENIERYFRKKHPFPKYLLSSYMPRIRSAISRITPSPPRLSEYKQLFFVHCYNHVTIPSFVPMVKNMRQTDALYQFVRIVDYSSHQKAQIVVRLWKNADCDMITK